MAINEDLYAGLTGHAGLSALIGTRLYPVVLPQDPTLPAVTYTRISGVRERAMPRAAVAVTSRYQFDVFTAGRSAYDAAAAVRVQLRAALLVLAGSSVTIYDVSLDTDQDLWDEETELWQLTQDALILHTE